MKKHIVPVALATVLGGVSPQMVLATEVAPPAAGAVPAGAYNLDKAHASLIFRVNHLGFSHWTARFTTFDSNLQFDPVNLAASQVNVTIDPAAITPDNPLLGSSQRCAAHSGSMSGNFPDDIPLDADSAGRKKWPAHLR